jgi:hypothetical protein
MYLNIRLYLLAAFAPLFLGCAGQLFTVPIKPIDGLNGQDKIDMAITLHLNNELCNLSRELQVGFGVLELKGDILCENATRVANAVFSDVAVDRHGNNFSNSRPILSSQFVNVINSIGMWTGSPSNMTITIEWKMSTSEGKLIWLDTVSGSAIVRQGTAFSYKKKRQRHLQMTLDDLYEKSFRSIISSIEIRNYAQR